MAKQKSKALLEDGVQRLVLACVAGGKIVGEAVTKCLDTYKEKHEDSEKKEQGGWLEDLLKNTTRSMEELLRHLSKAPKEMADTYLGEEEDEDDEKKKEKEVTKEEPKIKDKEAEKEATKKVDKVEIKKEVQDKVKEKDKETNVENKKPPAKAKGKNSTKAASSKKSKS